jgi:N-acetylglucosamine malate deacetylase 1
MKSVQHGPDGPQKCARRKVTMNSISRREALKSGAAAFGLPLLQPTDEGEGQKKLSVVVVGAHPDDPASGCGGTAAFGSGRGPKLILLGLTRGEAGIPGTPHDEAARIRTLEAEMACKILGAEPRFAGQVDGATEVTARRYEEFRKILAAERPDLVFTHWPIDSHRDHRAASLLVFDAWLASERSFRLYYYEVMSGTQTSCFSPTRYVDIGKTVSLKKEACYAHKSQNPDEFYADHDAMNRFRGMEYGCRVAEAFVRHNQDRSAAGVPV